MQLKYNWQQAHDLSDEHYELLLIADPDSEKIDNYILDCEICVATCDSHLAGILAMGPIAYRQSSDVYEIYNLAVATEFQRRGVGRGLIKQAIEFARSSGSAGFDALLVRTGNSSLAALNLYTRAGFRIVEIQRDYFPQNYKEPIIEDGIPCLDQLVLLLTLDSK